MIVYKNNKILLKKIIPRVNVVKPVTLCSEMCESVMCEKGFSFVVLGEHELISYTKYPYGLIKIHFSSSFLTHF